MIRAVHATQLPLAWPYIEPHLKRFEKQGEASAERIRYLAEQREAQVWTFDDGGKVHGVLVTQVQDTTNGRRLLIWVAVGSSPDLRDEISEALSVLEPWGREIGCNRVRIVGRKGWSKVMPDFREVGRVLEKRL